MPCGVASTTVRRWSAGSRSAGDEVVALHAREHAGEAGPEDEGLARHPAGVDRAVLAQHAQHAPLLVGQRVLAQAGPGVAITASRACSSRRGKLRCVNVVLKGLSLSAFSLNYLTC
jgi:hypothetical protein